MAASVKRLPFANILPFLKNQTTAISATLSLQKRQLSNVQPKVQETLPDYTKIENEMAKEVITKVNDQIMTKTHGRLFAVVHLQGLQYKITQNDLLVITRKWAPTLGDVIRLEKVLLVGSRDFTLIGRPLLPKDQVSVIATIIEKRLSSTKSRLTYTPRKNNTKWIFLKNELTYLRINSITINGNVNELGDTDGLADRIFL